MRCCFIFKNSTELDALGDELLFEEEEASYLPGDQVELPSLPQDTVSLLCADLRAQAIQTEKADAAKKEELVQSQM